MVNGRRNFGTCVGFGHEKIFSPRTIRETPPPRNRKIAERTARSCLSGSERVEKITNYELRITNWAGARFCTRAKVEAASRRFLLDWERRNSVGC
jgi:hypothetical protein